MAVERVAVNITYIADCQVSMVVAYVLAKLLRLKSWTGVWQKGAHVFIKPDGCGPVIHGGWIIPS